MIIEIPGYKTLDLDYLVLDYNGTIAVDGLIPPAIKERLLLLGDSFKIYVLTADTHGTASSHNAVHSLHIYQPAVVLSPQA